MLNKELQKIYAVFKLNKGANAYFSDRQRKKVQVCHNPFATLLTPSLNNGLLKLRIIPNL